MSKLISEECPLLVFPSLAATIGLNEAIVLQQVHYLLDSGVNKNYQEGYFWFDSSYEEWQKKISFWSIRSLRRIIKSLEFEGFLISKKFNLNNLGKTKCYTINYRLLASLNNNTSNHFFSKSDSLIENNIDIEDFKEREDKLVVRGAMVSKSEEEINDPIWKEIRLELRKQLGEEIFESWISNLKFSKINNNVVYLEAPTKFIREWIVNNFGDAIKREFNIYGTNIQQIYIA